MSTSERRTGRKHHTPRRNHPLLFWYPLFLLLCLLLLPIPAYAQEPGPTTWEWRTFTTDNSPLAPDQVSALFEDSQGHIWIGTWEGVSVYAQGTWQTFTADNTSLAWGLVMDLLEDSQGRIWVGTSEGVSLYQDELWQTFTADNSPLAPGVVRNLVEDTRGRVWVGSDEGLSFYHEGTWQTFTAHNSPLAPGRILQLLEDAKRRIWVGTEGGLSFYQNDVWQTFTADNAPPPLGEVTELLEDSRGRIWVGTKAGLSLYRQGVWQPLTAGNSPISTEEISELLEDSQGRIWVGTEGGLSLYQGGVWQVFAAGDASLAPGSIREILEDSQGRIWIGTSEGVTLYDKGVMSTLAAGPATQLLEDSQGRIWINNGYSVRFYDAGNWQIFDSDNSPLARGQITELLEDTQGRIWIGTGGGVSLYQESTWKIFRADNSSLAGGEVRRLLEDSQGRIWAGHGGIAIGRTIWVRTGGGVSLYQGEVWQSFTADNSSLAPGWVSTLLEDSQGRIWVGTGGIIDAQACIGTGSSGGLSVYRENSWQTFTTENSPLPSNWVNRLLEDSQGRIWVGTLEGVGVYEAGTWQAFNAGDRSLPSGWVTALLEDASGDIWVGTSRGLHLYRAGSWQTIPHSDSSLAPGTISVLLQDAHGQMWVGTYDSESDTGSVGLYQAGVWQVFTADNSPMISGGVRDILVDSQDCAWIGTEEGLSLYCKGTWQTFTAHDPYLAPGGVRELLQDSQGRIWVGTSGGLSIFAQGAWQTFTADDSPLPSLGDRELLEDAQGRIWVGTYVGISVRRPGDRPCAFLRYASSTPNQVMSLRSTSALTLTSSSPSPPLSVSFAGTDAESPPKRLLFRCQLVEYDQEEIPCTSPIHYGALSPGNYTFHVRALDEDLMSSKPTTATFTLISTAPLIERVMTRLPREVAFPLVGGLGGLAVAIVFGAMIWSRVRRARALRRGFNPYEAGRPILDPDRFFGREALIAQVLNTIHQNDVLIHGERRIGKTSLLRQLEHRLRAMDDPDYQFIPVYVDAEGVPQAEFFHLLMEEIVATCRETGYTPPTLSFTGKAAADYTYRDFLRDLQFLLETLQPASHKTIRLILLLDEVDVMNGYDQLVQQQFRRILMKRFAQQVGVVASGVHVFREWSREESPFRNLFVEIHLGTMEEEAARRLITEPVKGIYSYDDEAVDLILRYSEHKPWRIQRLCLEVVNRLLADRRTRVTRQDVEEVHRRMLSEETEWAVPQGEYPALVPASLPAAEEKAEYRAKPEGDRDA